MNGSEQSSVTVDIGHLQVMQLVIAVPEPRRCFRFRPPPLGNQRGGLTCRGQCSLPDDGAVTLGGSSLGSGGGGALGPAPS
jgi:hypothetical protein